MRHRTALLAAAILLAGCAAPDHHHTHPHHDHHHAVATATPPASRARTTHDPTLLTVAEASNYNRTGTGDEVDALLSRLASRSDLLTLSSIGTTNEGRDITLAVLADPQLSSPDEARRDERLTVLLIGNIHAGEVCGKEALCMIARDLALTPDHPLLDHLIILFLPNYNADGNDRFDPHNRPGQCGPDEMGVRHNAQGFDLNRDYVKAEAPETRALIGLLNEWDPTVIVDTHTTNGSPHRYTLTYQGPKHPGGDTLLLETVRDEILPDIDDRFEQRSGFLAFFYGNLVRDNTLWVTYPANPRYGVAYRGLRNRVSILSEAYAYATFEDRVRATYDYCIAVLEHAAENARELRTLVHEADRRTIDAGRAGAPIAVRTTVQPFPEPIDILATTTSECADGAGHDVTYTVDFVNDFVPTLEVPRPRAYAVPESLHHVVRQLHVHGIATRRLDEPLEILTETDTVLGFDRATDLYQGHLMIANVETSARRARVILPAGTVLVPTDQPLGSLASYLLEPRASDGLVAWNFLDAELSAGADFPIVRVLEPLPER